MELLQVFGSSDQETESWFTNQEPLIPTPPSHPSVRGERGLSLLPNFQKRRLDRTSIFRGGWWERGGSPFSEGGGGIFRKKDKLKSRILDGKKVYKQEWFALS